MGLLCEDESQVWSSGANQREARKLCFMPPFPRGNALRRPPPFAGGKGNELETLAHSILSLNG